MLSGFSVHYLVVCSIDCGIPPPPPEKLAVLMYTDLYRELTDDYKLQTWDLIVSRSGTTADDKPASLTDVTANRWRC